MSGPEYHFVTRWRIAAPIEEVADILSDGTSFPRWWPAVYLEVRELEHGDPKSRVGAELDLYTRGWLPYTLSWQCRVTAANHPHGFTLDAWGDFIGTGVWRLEQQASETLIEYDWRVRAGKPLLRRMSWLLRPVFEANHRWAMDKGEESLRLELQRRRATTDAERAAIAMPPQGVPWPGMPRRDG